MQILVICYFEVEKFDPAHWRYSGCTRDHDTLAVQSSGWSKVGILKTEMYRERSSLENSGKCSANYFESFWGSFHNFLSVHFKLFLVSASRTCISDIENRHLSWN